MNKLDAYWSSLELPAKPQIVEEPYDFAARRGSKSSRTRSDRAPRQRYQLWLGVEQRALPAVNSGGNQRRRVLIGGLVGIGAGLVVGLAITLALIGAFGKKNMENTGSYAPARAGFP